MILLLSTISRSSHNRYKQVQSTSLSDQKRVRIQIKDSLLDKAQSCPVVQNIPTRSATFPKVQTIQPSKVFSPKRCTTSIIRVNSCCINQLLSELFLGSKWPLHFDLSIDCRFDPIGASMSMSICFAN